MLDFVMSKKRHETMEPGQRSFPLKSRKTKKCMCGFPLKYDQVFDKKL